MQAHTCAAIAALLKSDPTVSPRERQHFLAKNDEPPEADHIVRPLIAARRLGLSRRSLANLIAAGQLPAVKLPGRQRIIGVRESDLSALIEGKRPKGPAST